MQGGLDMPPTQRPAQSGQSVQPLRMQAIQPDHLPLQLIQLPPVQPQPVHPAQPVAIPPSPQPQSLSHPLSQPQQQPPPHATPRRRAGVACRRCRRQRTKCLHQHGQAPCDSCAAAGPAVAETCAFPTRGEKDTDRLFRRRATGQVVGQDGVVRSVREARSASSDVRSDGRSDDAMPSPDASPSRESSGPATASGPSQSPALPPLAGLPLPLALPLTRPLTPLTPLPPPHEIVEGCRVFMTSYFQLGFLPKAVFLERLHRRPDATSPFLLAGMLAIGARFTPALVRRYGTAAAATEHFLATARALALSPAQLYRPSLERTQAYFLLAIAEWGNGERDCSAVHMGVAVRMAALLKLHREEAYVLPAGASSDQMVRAESARRTFWMIMSQENLHAGHMSPAPFAREDVSARLPCDEADFAFGVEPAAGRAVLAGTQPALLQPALVNRPDRCLFATLVQAHDLWGRVARCTATAEAAPWEPGSAFGVLTAALRSWEDAVPARHRWSVWNLRGWCAESLHLAYLSVVMVVRLGNIVIRRVYLERMIEALEQTEPAGTGPANTPEGLSPGTVPLPTPATTTTPTAATAATMAFWRTTSYDLFANVLELHEQVDAYARMRMRDEGFPAILVFCAYMCGSLTAYLGRHPRLCPHIAPGEARDMARGAIAVLAELQPAWPTTAKWHQGLQHAAEIPAAESGAAMDETADPALGAPIPTVIDTTPAPPPAPPTPQPWDGNTPRERNGGFDAGPGSFALAANVNSSYAIFPPLDPFLDDQFSAEVSAFLDLQYGV